jgi:hypothetical protein
MLWCVLSGCATTPHGDHQAPPTALDVQFELIPSTDVFIPNVEAVVIGDHVEIQGMVRRKPGNCCDTTQGTINVSILTPSGDLFDSVDTAHSPRNIPNSRLQSSRFTAYIPYILPDQFILRIEYLRS